MKQLTVLLISGLIALFFTQKTTADNNPAGDAKEQPATEALVKQCQAKGFNFQNKLLVLQPETGLKQTIYLIKNLKDYLIILNRANNTASASAGWASQLSGQKWSAFALNRSQFTFSCLARKPGMMGFIPCQDVLQVCSLPPLTTPNNNGTFWVSEDKDLTAILADFNARNIKLPETTNNPTQIKN